MRLNSVIFVVSVIFISATTGSRRCYECQNAPFPRDCTHVTLCGEDEECYIEQMVTTGGLIVYNSGCKSKSRCAGLGKRGVVRGLNQSERSLDIVTCAQCCMDEFCNNKGCGQTDVPRDQRGPICFTCDGVIDPSTCTKVQVCDDNEICGLVQRTDLPSYPEIVYRGFCEARKACDAFANVYHQTKCPPTCCEDDYCNAQCGLTLNNTMTSTSTVTSQASSAVTSTTIAGPTTVITTANIAQTHTPPIQTHCKAGNFYDDIYGICIRLVQSQDQTFDGAKDKCESYGERLVVIDTHAKMVFIENMLLHHTQAANSLNDYAFWIGLRNKDDKSPFVWIDGQPLQYTYWGGGDEVASNQQPDMENHQNCVVIVSRDHFMWHDDQCNTHHGYVCEEIPAGGPTTTMQTTTTTQAPTTTTTNLQCDFQWQTSCYRLTQRGDSYTNGVAACAQFGGYPAVIDTQAEQTVVETQLRNQTQDIFYFGLYQPDNTDWVWQVDNTVLGTSWNGWAKGEPNGRDRENCGALWTHFHYHWADENCQNNYRMICEISPTVHASALTTTQSETPITEQTNNISTPKLTTTTTTLSTSVIPSCTTSGDYQVLTWNDSALCVKVHNDGATWNDARLQCQTENADLVVLNTPGKTYLVKYFLKGNGIHDCWLGAKDFSMRDSFTWVNQQPVVAGDWASGHPVDRGGGHIQNCVAIGSTNAYTWRDVYCHNTYSYMCERPI